MLQVIRDHGRWQPPAPTQAEMTWRGRGLPLIRALADHTRLSHDENGTTLTTTWNLPTIVPA